MKWGRNKASPASFHPSLITHVFPGSWFSKFKKKRDDFEHKSAKAKHKVQQGSPSSYSLPYAPWKEGRFYSGEDDPYWRLSFGEEAAERSKVWLNSVWDGPNDNEHVSIPNSGRSNAEGFWMFNDMASDGETHDKVPNTSENEEFRREKVSEGEERKLASKNTVKIQRSRRTNQRTFQEQQERISNTAEKAMFEVQPENIIHTGEGFSESRAPEARYRRSFSFPKSNLRTIEENCILKTLNLETSDAFSKVVEEEEEEINLQCKRLEDMKIKEMMLKTEERGSVYIDRSCQRKKKKQTSRIKCSSPRTAAKIECKVRALEDMKKAKMRKKRSKETTLRDRATFESYAVAKSSFNPQKDFRDSMIEMIMEKGIQTPEELEELLACYLTLNYDEYHDLIIKVFRQVYFELNQVHFASQLQDYLHCHDQKFL